MEIFSGVQAAMHDPYLGCVPVGAISHGECKQSRITSATVRVYDSYVWFGYKRVFNNLSVFINILQMSSIMVYLLHWYY